MENNRTAVAFYGKVRIPTIGHKEAIDHAKSIAKEHDAKLHIGLSGTSHPLSSKSKRAHAEALFDHPVMPEGKHTSNLISFLSHINQKHDHLHLVAGSDRAADYKKLISKYNGKKDKQGNTPFNFKSWKVHEVPGRRINSRIDARKMSKKELVQSVSASKLESLAHEGQYEQFKAYHPGLKDQHVRRVYNEIRSAGRIDEEVSRKDFGPMLTSFIDFASDKLGLKSLPNVRYKDGKDQFVSFGAYSPDKKEIAIHTKDRHPMDIYRTIAHELVHHKQNEDGKLKDPIKDGETGSPHENDANTMAGKILRWYAKANPGNFELSHLGEERQAIIVIGGPCSGKNKVINTLKEAFDYPEYDMVRLTSRFPVEQKVIINGSADDLKKISAANEMLKDLNYKTSLIFVDVENNISKLRNEERASKGQRTINESVRQEKYDASKNNIEKLKEIFGEDMKIVDNSVQEEVKKPTGGLKKACWKGYTAVGMKMKGGKKVPNCVPVKETVDDKFNSAFNSKPKDREFATDSLAKIYAKSTPGQTYPFNPLFESHKKKKIIRKKLNQEGILDNAATTVGLSVNGDAVGPEFAISRVPGITAGLGTGYSFPFGTFEESITKWINNPVIQERFLKKYGNLAEEKLIETATKLNETKHVKNIKSKTINEIRDSLSRGNQLSYPSNNVGLSSSVPGGSRYKDGDFMEEGSPAWQRKEGKNPEGGLNKKGVASYRREHPGSKLSTAVTTDPSKLKKGSKKAKRRLSFCRRMKGMKKKLTSAKTARDPDSRINKSLRKWNCEE